MLSAMWLISIYHVKPRVFFLSLTCNFFQWGSLFFWQVVDFFLFFLKTRLGKILNGNLIRGGGLIYLNVTVIFKLSLHLFLVFTSLLWVWKGIPFIRSFSQFYLEIVFNIFRFEIIRKGKRRHRLLKK